MSGNDEFLGDFKEEALELLDEAEESLRLIEKGSSPKDQYNQLFRVFHSIKGGAGMLDFTKLEKIVHFLEDQLNCFENEECSCPQILNFFYHGVDCCRDVLDGKEVDFKFVCPTSAEAPAKRSRESKSESEDLHKPLVYHVDDSRAICMDIKNTLESNEFRVKSFTAPEEFLKGYTENPVDIVISDYNMPGYTGLDIIKAVKKINPDAFVILLSGELDKRICIEAISRGAHALLEKTHDKTDLMMTLMTTVEAARSRRIANRSIKLLLYQFSDLMDFLRASNKDHIAETISKEIQILMEERGKARNGDSSNEAA